MLYGSAYVRTSCDDSIFHPLLHPLQQKLPQKMADDGEESRENDHEARGHCGGQILHNAVDTCTMAMRWTQDKYRVRALMLPAGSHPRWYIIGEGALRAHAAKGRAY